MFRFETLYLIILSIVENHLYLLEYIYTPKHRYST